MLKCHTSAEPNFRWTSGLSGNPTNRGWKVCGWSGVIRFQGEKVEDTIVETHPMHNVYLVFRWHHLTHCIHIYTNQKAGNRWCTEGKKSGAGTMGLIMTGISKIKVSSCLTCLWLLYSHTFKDESLNVFAHFTETWRFWSLSWTQVEEVSRFSLIAF